MQALARQHCAPRHGPALGDGEADELLRQLGSWARRSGALERTFEFAGYAQAMAFANAVAWIAQCEDHHPDLQVGYRRCTVRWSTHSTAGLSLNDFICAAKVDVLLPTLQPAALP